MLPWKADAMKYDNERKGYVDSKGKFTPKEYWWQWDLNRQKRLAEIFDPYPFKAWSSWAILAAVFLLLWMVLS